MVELIQGIQELLLTLALGGLIGLEREFGRQVLKKEYPFGIRTTILICFIGLLFVYLGEAIDLTTSVITGLVSVIILSVTTYVVRSKKYNSYGLTSHAAIIISYIIGVLVGFKQYLIAIIIAVLTTALLGFRREIHSIIKLMNRSELKASIEFLIIIFIIFPLMPDNYIDPFGVFNPFRFWLLVASISTISFVSFLCVKSSLNGLNLTGLLGGLISSKITTVKLASLVKENEGLLKQSFNGIILSIASSIGLALAITMIALPNYALLSRVFLPLFASTAIILLFSIKRVKKEHQHINIKSTFSITSSIKFALLLLAFIYLFTLISDLIDPSLVYVAVLISSLVSNPASVASITSLAAAGKLSIPVAANLIVFACVISLLDKIVYVKIGRNKKLNKMIIKSTVAWAIIIMGLLLIQNYLLP